MNSGRFGLPTKVVYCKRCTISNQRPNTSVEFTNDSNSKKEFINFDKDGICDACKYTEIKKRISWEDREKELKELLNKYRKSNGEFDVIVPGSGGKDSVMTAHILKNKRYNKKNSLFDSISK